MFLRVHAAFDSTVVSWAQTTEKERFPDVIVKRRTGDDVSFELTEWVHGEQLAAEMRLKPVKEGIDAATRAVGPNRSKYVYTVSLSLRGNPSRFAQADGIELTAELKSLLDENESRWPSEQHWHSPQGRQVMEFPSYPCLDKYLAKLVIYPPSAVTEPLPARRRDGFPWISIASGKFYRPEWATDALKKAMQAKIARYGPLSIPPRLLVHYGQAAVYNTPFTGPGIHEFEDVARVAAQMVAEQEFFEKIYLLSVLEPAPEAYEVFPVFSRCT